MFFDRRANKVAMAIPMAANDAKRDSAMATRLATLHDGSHVP